MSEENTNTTTVDTEKTPEIVPVNIDNPSEADLLNMDEDYLQLMEEAEKETNKQSKPEKKVEDQESKVKLKEEDASDTDKNDVDNSGSSDDSDTDTESEYEDNIIPGLTGKQFEALDEPLREIVGKTREELDTVSKKATEAEERLNRLMNDPIVKHRDEVIQNGLHEETYEIPGLDDQTTYKLQQLAMRKTPESMAAFKEAIHNLMGSAADTAADNVRLQGKQELQRQQTLDTANKNVEALAKLLKVELPSNNLEELKNMDVNKLGKVGTILKDLTERSEKGVIGGLYNYLANVDVEELYASMAVKNKWPIIKNADEVLHKEIKKSNEKFYKRFLKGRPDESSGSLATGKIIDQKKAASKSVHDGVDLVKLATDDEYHEQMLYSKPNDPDWMTKITEMRLEGERMIEDNPRLRAPQKKQ
jgi:hypothetical protein